MVFVRTLELTKAIQHWLMQHRQLSHLNPGRMTGSKKAATDGGESWLQNTLTDGAEYALQEQQQQQQQQQ